MQININDIVLNYTVSGCGPDLVMLHGWGMDLHTFDNVSRELSEDFTVYQIDLPGFGESVLPFAFKIDDYVDIINEFIIKLKMVAPILIGHSFGGRIAMKYASLYKVSKLILVASPGVKEKFSLIKYLRIKMYKLAKRVKLNLKMGSNDYKNANPILRKTLVSAVNEDLSIYLSSITAPTLLIYGANDKVVPLYIGKKINKMIRSSGIVAIPNANHFPYIEKFRYFIIVIKHFLLSDDR